MRFIYAVYGAFLESENEIYLYWHMMRYSFKGGAFSQSHEGEPVF